MTTHDSDPTPRRILVLLTIVRGAVSGAVHAGLTWLIDQLTGAV